MSKTLVIGIIAVLVLINIAIYVQSGKSASSYYSGNFDTSTNIQKSLDDLKNLIVGRIQKNQSDENEQMQKLEKLGNSGTGPEFENMIQKVIEFSRNQIGTRKAVLNSVIKGIKQEKAFWNVYGALGPEAFCFSKVRIGTVGDGGKWVCNPWKLPENCVLFSLGLNNFIQFEEDLQRMISNRCKVYGFDKDDQNPMTLDKYKAINATSRKAMITAVDDVSKSQFTIVTLAKDANVDHIDFLKIDIEGAEHQALIPFLEKSTVCQIFIEIHGIAPKHAQLLQDIGKLKYRMFSYEVNGFDMSACEYSFIHESCLEKYGARPLANYLE